MGEEFLGNMKLFLFLLLLAVSTAPDTTPAPSLSPPAPAKGSTSAPPQASYGGSRCSDSETVSKGRKVSDSPGSDDKTYILVNIGIFIFSFLPIIAIACHFHWVSLSQ